jgi:alkanesulfonate monooxygenase SsuD/methylene tetrahydromethanopterin reductase-like flavin-dependent oxidoreductase (luciferase family)
MASLIAVDDDRERARTAIRAAICSFFHPIPHTYYEFLLREQGFSEVADACLKFVPEGRPEEAMEKMDDALVDTLAFAGTPEDCARRLTDYEGLVDEAIWLNVGGGDASTVLDAHRGVIAVKGATT